MKLSGYIFLFCSFTSTALCHGQLNLAAAESLLQRVLKEKAKFFVVEPITALNEKDVFEIESRQNKIVLRGNTGVAISSALHYYLNEYVHCQVTWNSETLKLPALLPAVKNKIRKQTLSTN